MVQVCSAKFISSHRVSAASTGRVTVNNCHSISKRVCRSILAMDSVCINSGSCSGRIVGMCFFTGVGKALRTFAAVLTSIRPLFAAKSITSFIRCNTRFRVSRFPLALIGSNMMTNILAVSSLIGLLPMSGNTYFSSERQISFIVFAARFWLFFISYQSAATFRKVFPLRSSSASRFCCWWACGSIPCAMSDRYNSRFLRASASVTSSIDPKLTSARFLSCGR